MNENRVRWKQDSLYQLDDCKTFAPKRINKGCESKSVTLPLHCFLFAMSCSFHLPPCLLVSGVSKEAREENEIPACIYSSPYFPSILTRRQTVVINFISDCLPKALVDVTRNLTVEIIVDNPYVCICMYTHLFFYCTWKKKLIGNKQLAFQFLNLL